MHRKTTLFLLLAVAAAGLFIALVERRTESVHGREERLRAAVQIDPRRVTSLRIESAAVTIECAKEGDTWRLRRPVRGRADAGRIERVLYGLSEIRRGEVISAAELGARGLTLADYGLGEPQARITFGDERGRRTVLVGRKAPLGESVYIKEDSADDVMVVPAGILDLLPVSAEALRDRALLPGGAERVRRLGIARAGGYLQVALGADGVWMIQQPLAARADGARVLKLLGDLFALRIEEFIADGVSDPSAYGLGEPRAELTVWSGQDEAGATLRLGQPVEGRKNLIYAKWKEGDSVFAVPAEAGELLNLGVVDVRDRRLLPLASYEIAAFRVEEDEFSIELRREGGTWWIVEPRRFKADAERVRAMLDTWTGMLIENFVDNQGTNAAALGFDPPARILSFTRRAALPGEAPVPPAAATAVRLLISSIQPEEGRLLARLESEDPAYEIPLSAMDTVSITPLFFRDREVLALAPNDIRRIGLTRGGVEQALERPDAAEPFAPATAGGGMLEQKRLEELLGALAHLDCTGFVAEDPRDLAPFGLDEPWAVLNLGLSGSAGIGRTILFGADAPGADVYGMVQGQDVVFMLARSVVHALTGDLYSAPGESSEAPVDARTDNSEER